MSRVVWVMTCSVPTGTGRPGRVMSTRSAASAARRPSPAAASALQTPASSARLAAFIACPPPGAPPSAAARSRAAARSARPYRPGIALSTRQPGQVAHLVQRRLGLSLRAWSLLADLDHPIHPLTNRQTKSRASRRDEARPRGTTLVPPGGLRARQRLLAPITGRNRSRLLGGVSAVHLSAPKGTSAGSRRGLCSR